MYESRIAADQLTATSIPGFPEEIDALAACNLAGHGFLRAAWYAARAEQLPADTASTGRTLLIRRGSGEVIAAIPTIAFGPAVGRARKVPGSYWPLRSPLIAPDCDVVELAQGLERGRRNLAPVWRVGPAPANDPAIALLTEAALRANWSILSRPAGTSWAIDLDAARAEGWPRPSTAKRLAKAERRLAQLGRVEWHYVRGQGWNERVLEQLAAIEQASWIASTTDGSGAKFLSLGQRALWRRVLADPVLADMLCATILTIDDAPVAFSFDLYDGAVQYGIAGSYVRALAKYEIGKIVNARAISDAIAAGLSVTDLGVGDTGYKEYFGASPAYDMEDLLFVRSRTAARILANAWGRERTPVQPVAPRSRVVVMHG